jgi:hypothetical protein
MANIANGVIDEVGEVSESDSDSEMEATDDETLRKLEKGLLFRCKHCKIFYADRCKLKNHAKSCKENFTIKCKYCNGKVPNFSALSKHKIKQH